MAVGDAVVGDADGTLVGLSVIVGGIDVMVGTITFFGTGLLAGAFWPC